MPQKQILLTQNLNKDEQLTEPYEAAFYKSNMIGSVQSLSYVQLCDPMDCSTPGFPVSHYLQSLLKLMSIESLMPSNYPILCSPILFLPSVFPSISDFSSDLAFHMRKAKYWSFIFSLSPSNEYSGLISLRIDIYIALYIIV